MKIRVDITDGWPGRSVACHPKLMARLRLGRSLKLTFGGHGMEGTLRRYPAGARADLILSRQAAATIGLAHATYLWARRTPGNLRLGPVVGLLVASVTPADQEHPFGSQSDLLATIAERGRWYGAFVYVFTPDSVDWTLDKVSGYSYLAGGKRGWHRIDAPFPDVIYDRIHTRSLERTEAVRGFKQRARLRPGTAVFPHGFLDKWDVHQAFSHVPEVRPYLPDTARLRDQRNLRDFLHRHSVVYLKPTRGSLGVGIIRVEKHAGLYKVLVEKQARVRTTSFKRLIDLWERIRPVISRSPYIVQQGLALASATAHFDIRVLMQKDETNKWQRTKMFARVAKPGSITSNISGGAVGAPVAATIRPQWGAATTQFVDRLREAALLMAETTESTFGGPIGELGVDLGLDRDGKIWLIELNSKPNRSLNEGTPQVIQQSFDRPLGYARYLSGFGG